MKPLALFGHSRPVTQVLFNYTGDLLFSCGKDGNLCVWDVSDGVLLGQYQPIVDGEVSKKAIWGIDLTYDGSRLIVASAEGVFVFEVETAEQLHHISLDAVCRAISWNKKPLDQNKFVAARDSFGTRVQQGVVVYSYREEESKYVMTHEYQDYKARCIGVAWGPFDQTVISRHSDGTINVWDLDSGKKILEKKVHDGEVTAMDFSLDRVLCLTACNDGTACLWTVPNWNLVQTYKTDRPLNGCSISPLYNREDDTKRMHILVAGGQEAAEVTTTKAQEGKQEAILMHLVNGETLGFISGHFSPINSLTFMPDGKGFATGAEEGNCRIYRFDPSYFEANKFI